ncbi:hypothetical protein HDU96_005275, partial [Phlyctochytrium bullatum]
MKCALAVTLIWLLIAVALVNASNMAPPLRRRLLGGNKAIRSPKCRRDPSKCVKTRFKQHPPEYFLPPTPPPGAPPCKQGYICYWNKSKGKSTVERSQSCSNISKETAKNCHTLQDYKRVEACMIALDKLRTDCMNKAQSGKDY